MYEIHTKQFIQYKKVQEDYQKKKKNMYGIYFF